MSPPTPPQPEDSGRQSLRSEFADDPEMAELIEFFVGSMPERLASLTDSWRRREFESLRRLAHQLKGASGGYGFPQVGAAAERLERELNEVEPARFETIRAEFEELINLCRRVVA